jgi:DNA-binding NtrC family response regulator
LAEAEGGTLFLDEVHNLPPRAQRSLLRFAEDGLLAPIGSKARPRKVDVRLVLGTNVVVDRALSQGELTRDLVARLHRVAIPGLNQRRADVPSIFVHILETALGRFLAHQVVEHLDVLAVERLSLHDYSDVNVRCLEDIAAVINARMDEGEAASTALSAALDEALGAPPRRRQAHEDVLDQTLSIYERHREEIVSAHRLIGNNLSQLETSLRDRGLKVNRRWLATYLDRWGIRRARTRR